MVKSCIKLLLLVIMCFSLLGCGNISDGKRFKEEYESLNDEMINESLSYKSVNIPEENNVQYKTDEEIIDIIKEETAVIYFGFNSCPWCRNMVENLVSITNNLAIENVYYVDVKNIRDTLEVNASGEVIRTASGTASYMALLELLNEYLDDYVLIDQDGEEIITHEKRIYAPNVLVVRDGQILGLTTGISDKVTDPFADLKEDIQKENYDLLYDLIYQIKPNNSCHSTGGC